MPLAEPATSPFAVALEISDGVAPSQRLSITGQNLVIGRSPDAQVHLDRNTISRRHAEIFCDPYHRWFVRDLGSRNGTRVNGRPGLEHPIQSGDLLGVGEFTLRIVSLGALTRAQDSTIAPTGTSLAVTDASSEISTLHDMDTPRVSASHLSLINELGQNLLSLPDAPQRLRELCRMVVRDEFHGRCAMVLRLSKDRPLDEPMVLSPAEVNPAFLGFAPYISRSILRALRQKEMPLLASNATHHPTSAEISISPDILAISAIACPLHIDDHIMDVLYAVLPPEYGTGEWLALTTMAAKQYEQAENAWAARKRQVDHESIERELRKARDIQLRLLPAELSIPGLDVAIGFKPCRWVGGDYPDAIPTRDGRSLLIIADVCGKGLPAALIAQSLHATTRISMRAGVPLVDLIHNIAEYLRESCPHTSFVTLCAILLDSATGELECINAGHPPALILSPGGEMRALQSSQHLPLGIEEETFSIQHDRIAPGQVLAMYTDGLIDLVSPDGKSLGTDELYKQLSTLVAQEPLAPARHLASRLTSFLDTLQGTALSADDRTFLLARRA
jgi:sigma-B regulation protein RsbU (phosphoserine phosphatase)